MSKYQPFTITSLEDLLDAMHNLPLKDQKIVAEDILRRFWENHWEIFVDYDGSLRISKTEEL
jgi:hypothetical protein